MADTGTAEPPEVTGKPPPAQSRAAVRVSECERLILAAMPRNQEMTHREVKASVPGLENATVHAIGTALANLESHGQCERAYRNSTYYVTLAADQEAGTPVTGPAGASARWLAEQDGRALLIARDIISRRKSLAEPPRWTSPDSEFRRVSQARDEGVIAGLRLALSYLGDRPGDISDTGAEGFIVTVESADEYVREEVPDGN